MRVYFGFRFSFRGTDGCGNIVSHLMILFEAEFYAFQLEIFPNDNFFVRLLPCFLGLKLKWWLSAWLYHRNLICSLKNITRSFPSFIHSFTYSLQRFKKLKSKVYQKKTQFWLGRSLLQVFLFFTLSFFLFIFTNFVITHILKILYTMSTEHANTRNEEQKRYKTFMSVLCVCVWCKFGGAVNYNHKTISTFWH